MNQELLCRWLGMDAKCWPPDPHALLGLLPGECDLGLIEKHVQDRLAKLRCYQLSHPEEATDGMNRVAQAFVCLSEAAARHQPAAPCVASSAPKPKSSDDTSVGEKTLVHWQAAPPPVRRVAPPAVCPTPTVAVAETIPETTAPPITSPVVVAEKPTPIPAPKPVSESGEFFTLARSTPARAGIGTLDALIERIYHTRRLLVAWERVGVFVQDKKRPLATAAEERELAKRLKGLQPQLDGFPPILAQPGKPGYRVAAMARLAMTPSMFRNTDELHRELLAQDWLAARKVLRAYRTFLRERFKSMRGKGAMGLVWRASRFFLNDHPALTATAALLVAAASCGIYFYLTRN